MDTMKDTKMQPATGAVIDNLRKMQATAWVYEDMLGRKCVGFERPLHRRNTHEPLFSAATHAVVMGLVYRIEAAEKERDALRAKVEAMEKQEPFDADSDVFRSAFEAALKAGYWPMTRQGDGYRSPSTQIAWRVAFSTVNRLKLYLAPGAKGE